MSYENSEQRRVPAKLCSICRTIPFDGLILPFVYETESDIHHVEAKESGFYDMSKDRTQTKIKFGLMSRVLQNEDNCGFCELVGNILRRHPTSPFGPQDKPIANFIGRPYYANLPEQADRPCEVKLMWFVGIKHPADPAKSRWSGRLFVNWKDDRGAYQGAYSCFQTMCQDVSERPSVLESSDPMTHELFCGGRKRPLTIDLDWVRHWISLCAYQHSTECSAAVHAPIRDGAKIRLINVKRMCLETDIDLMQPSASFQYMALSYVWGTDISGHKLYLNKNNLESLKRPGSITTDDLPRTLADTVYLAKCLNIAYVWIDAMCIVQDDSEDKIVQIGIMNAVYQHAFIGVIAAGGDGAEAGLPGLYPGTRSKSPKEITIRLSDLDKKLRNGDCNYITLLETLNPPEHTHWSPLTSTTWSTRAWTYQERMLSRRALIFTKEQLYWSCAEGNFCEEVCMEFPQQAITHHGGFIDPIETSLHTIFREFTLNPQESLAKRQSLMWKAYKTFVSEYSRRHLKYDGDYHAAFAGMTQALEIKSKDEFLLGHPRSRFEHGLSWVNYKTLRRRTTRSALPMTAKDERIIIPSWSWMGWIGEVVFNVTQEKEIDGTIPQIECFAHRTSPLRLVPARSSSNSSAPKESDWVYLSPDGPSLEDIQTHHPVLSTKSLEEIPDETVLFFWASTSRFRVEYPDMSDYNLKILPNVNDAHLPRILNDRGETIGELQPLEHTPTLDGNTAEFIVIERRSEPDPQMAALLGNEVRLTVLQIGWRIDEAGTGLCKERLNIGTIEEKEWLRSRPERKLIALQ